MRIGIAIAALTAAALAAGCQGRKQVPAPPAPSSAAASPSASPLDPQTVARQKALEAYRGMWRAYLDATRDANPDLPDLARYATGHALDTLTKGLRQVRDKGLRGKGDVVLTPTVEGLQPAAAPTRATVSDCVDTSGASLYKADGSAYQDPPGGKQAMVATVQDVGGGAWKVTSFGLRGVGTCT